MRILGFDTAAKTASVALWEDGKIVSEFYLNSGFTHSETALPMAKSLLDAAKCDIKDIDVFAVNCGPGSFTGLRIGIAAVKAIAMAENKPCASVSTLEALAYNLYGYEGIICPVMDARCGQMYTAFFRGSKSGIERLSDDETLMTDELYKKIEDLGEKVILVGDGAKICQKKFESCLCEIATDPLLLGRAFATCMVAAKLCENNELVTAEKLIPNYLKLAQAEKEKLEKEGKI